MGAIGWALMLAACVTVIFHPKPQATFLGRFAFRNEPLLQGSAVDGKRYLAILAVFAVAAVAFAVTVLAWTGGLNAIFEKYVFP